MKILVNTPCLALLGGVANHYLGLKGYWTENVCYNTIGKRKESKWSGLIWFPYDLLKFIFRLLIFQPDVVLLNPSVGKTALKRDSLYLTISFFLKKKIVVFFHGFNMDMINDINITKFTRKLNKTDGVIVLAEAFKDALLRYGVKVPIQLSTTKVDDKLLEGAGFISRTNIKQILLLSRITKEKGIFIALHAFAKLKQKYQDIALSVVGDGPDLSAAKELAEKLELKDVIFYGRLDGKELQRQYVESDLYLLPSANEGMPTSVLEAMAFGLPVVTRPVGGVKDFFEEGKMGILVESLDVNDFEIAIETLMTSSAQVISDMSAYNHAYAEKNFLASKVAISLEKILRQLILH